MALYYVKNPTTGVWGFVSREPSEAPVAAATSAALTPRPLAAALAPAPMREMSAWAKVTLGIAGAALTGVVLGTILNALTSKPKRVRSARPPRFLLPPPDPETVAIRRTAKRYVKSGAEVRADIAGWSRPPTINGYIPDVHAVYPDGREVVLEFENTRSVFSTHARRQHAAFSAHADEFGHVEYAQVVIRNGRGGRR